MKCTAILLFLVLCSLPASGVASEMYKWTDKGGIVHFSDHQGDPSAKQVDPEAGTQVTESHELPTNLVPHTTSLPGKISIKGLLLFDGKPLSAFTSADARIRIYDRTLRTWITPAFEYDGKTGAFQLTGIAEGSYSCDVQVNADPVNGQYPGDYKGSAHFSALLTSAPTLTVDMERLLHLTRPEDNNAPLENWGDVCMNKIEFVNPVRIAWEPLGKDISYTFTLVRTECSPFAWKETVAGDTITAADVVLDLLPNKTGEFYTLRIQAGKNNRPVGSLMTHGKNGWGWDYRFRVLPKRGPTMVISPKEK